MDTNELIRPCGGETEFGIIARNDANVQKTRYPGDEFIEHLLYEWLWPNTEGGGNVGWDGTARLEEYIDPVTKKEKADTDQFHIFLKDKTWLSRRNHLLPNGERLYLDGTHPESSIPLCMNPYQAVLYTRAGYKRVDDLRKKHLEKRGKKFTLFRNNVAFERHYWQNQESRRRQWDRVTYAFHENYAVARRIPEKELIRKITPFLILRIPIIGAGKVGSDSARELEARYQISQRADFLMTYVSSHTTDHRPIYNTRDVPYANRQYWRRLHVIAGDSNMLELPDYLKFGLMMILLSMIEDGCMDDRFEIFDPISAIHRISHDVHILKDGERVWLYNRRISRSMIDCLKEYADLFQAYVASRKPESKILHDVVERFGAIVQLLAGHDWAALHGQLDWVTKRHIIDRYLEKKNKSWLSDEAYHMDIQYSNNDHEKGIFFVEALQKKAVHILSKKAIERAVYEPPPTRSRWMVETIKRYRKHISNSNYWNQITFTDDELNLFQHPFYFSDPYVPWNEELVRRLYALPLPEFLAAAPSAGIGAEDNEQHYSGDRLPEPFPDFSYLFPNKRLYEL